MSAPKPFPTRAKAAGNGSGFGNAPMPIALENKPQAKCTTSKAARTLLQRRASVPRPFRSCATSAATKPSAPITNPPGACLGWSPTGSHGHRPKPPGGRRPKPISLRCVETGEVHSFSSHKQACEELMLEDTGLTRLSKGVQRTYRGLRLA